MTFFSCCGYIEVEGERVSDRDIKVSSSVHQLGENRMLSTVVVVHRLEDLPASRLIVDMNQGILIYSFEHGRLGQRLPLIEYFQ